MKSKKAKLRRVKRQTVKLLNDLGEEYVQL